MSDKDEKRKANTGVKANNEEFYKSGTKWQKKDIEETEQELREMSRWEACYGLTEAQITFCEHYVKTHNVKSSCIKAGYKVDRAHSVGWRIRQKYEARRYIAWLKLRITDEAVLEASQVVDMWMRIAFSDVTDYVSIGNNRIKLRDDQYIDGQIVKSVSQGKDGVKVELYDKMQALEKLSKYFEFMPKDDRIRIEERKLEIMEQRLQLDKERLGLGEKLVEDDGLFEALRGTAAEVWSDGDDE